MQASVSWHTEVVLLLAAIVSSCATSTRLDYVHVLISLQKCTEHICIDGGLDTPTGQLTMAHASKPDSSLSEAAASSSGESESEENSDEDSPESGTPLLAASPEDILLDIPPLTLPEALPSHLQDRADLLLSPGALSLACI